MLLYALLAQTAAAGILERRSDGLAVVDNVVSLLRIPGAMSPSTRTLAAARNSTGQTPAINLEDASEIIASVKVGTDTYKVIIDTGSSNPWLVEEGYYCYNPSDPTDKSYNCHFGKSYVPDSTLQRIPGINCNITYADGEFLTGDLGYETMTMAGITVKKQEFGLVNSAGWDGDGVTSGLFGFSYPAITMAFNGTDPHADEPSQLINYNPLFTSMIAQGVDPVFSLVVNKSTHGSGILALGGIAQGYQNYHYISTPIHETRISQDSKRKDQQFYAVNPTSFIWTNKTDGSNITHSVKDSPKGRFQHSPLFTIPKDYIVDSGTTLMYINNDAMVAFAKEFDPPAVYNKTQGQYIVPCDAKLPKFSIAFGKDLITIAPNTMLDPVGGKMCSPTIQSNRGSLIFKILGETFLKNVVAVYDVGNKQMKFAQRAADD